MQALVLDDLDVRAEFYANEDAYTFGSSGTSKKIALKRNKLHFLLMSYLRAHLLVSYQKDLKNYKVMTEPSDIEYEIYVLDAYKCFLDRV